jgi:hypothetical protein
VGHLLGTKSSLVPLIDRLNRYPVGLVDSDKLRTILSLLFTEQEAFVASRFPLHEATEDELTELTGLPATALRPVLETMANKGLVMDLPYGGTIYYLLIPGLIGFMEFTFMRRKPILTAPFPLADLATLMTEYLRENGRAGQGGEFFGSPTQLTRALAYAERIPVTSTITAYEDARRIIEEASYRAVTLCYCRHKKEHMGKTCRKGAPVEDTCMVFGQGARFLVRRGFAQERDKESMLATLAQSRARPDPRHRQRAREAVVHLQLLSLLLRADDRRSGRFRGRHRQDAIHRRSRRRALQLLRRLPQDLQRQVHRHCRRGAIPAQGRALRRGGCRRLPGLRRVYRFLRAGRPAAGATHESANPAEEPPTHVRAHPLGERAPGAVPDG